MMSWPPEGLLARQRALCTCNLAYIGSSANLLISKTFIIHLYVRMLNAHFSNGQVEMRLRQLEGGARLMDAGPKTPTQVRGRTFQQHHLFVGRRREAEAVGRLDWVVKTSCLSTNADGA